MPYPRTHLPQPAVGSGTYVYSLNGSPSGVDEHFEVRADSGGWQVSSTRSAPGQVELLVELEATDTHNATINISFASPSIGRRLALYGLHDGLLSVSIDEGPESRPESAEATDAVLSPLLRVFQGPAIAETIRAGGSTLVVMPKLDPTDAPTLLDPILQQRSAEPLGIEATNPGSGDIPWRHCRYMGGNYDDTADFWLDDRDRLVRYRFPQSNDQLWEVELLPG